MGKSLVKAGNFEIQEFLSRYNSIPKRTFNIIQEMINNTKFYEVKGWPKYSGTIVTREFKDSSEYTDNEISEASHIYMSQYVRTIKDYPWGFAISPKSDGRCGISFRSLPGSVNVRSLSESMMIGGGHDQAAGGTFMPVGEEKLDPAECLKKSQDWMKSNKPVIS
jgi:oligoribonuclease NrnB/cAMP/cGMP phosphodiesterase (DHH superfamily)